VSWIELIGYGAVLVVVVGLIWATYVLARRLTGSNHRAVWLVPVAVSGVTAVLGVLLTLYATQEIDRHA
jgi:hypothetical protein